MLEKDHYAPRSAWVLFMRMGGWIPMIFAAVVVLVSLIGQYNFSTAQRFVEEGRIATAAVADKYVRESRDSDGNRTYTYYLVMEFVTQRREEMSVRKSVGSSFYRRVDTGDAMEIRYLESDPDTVELREGDYARGAAALRWVALVLGVIWLGLFWVIGRWTVEALRARRYGQVEMAQLKEVMRTNVRINNSPRYRLVWTDGAGREGRSMLKKASEVEGWHGRDPIRVYQGMKRSWWAGDIGDRPDT